MQASLHYNISTIREKLDLRYHGLEQHLNLDILQGSSATHVVAEAGWGALTILVAKHPSTDQHSESVIKEKFQDMFDTLGSIIKDGDVGYISGDRDDQETTVDVYTDIVAKDHTIVTDISSAFQFVGEIPQLLTGMNGGKGQPTTYSLLPLGFLEYIFNIPTRLTITPLSVDCLSQFVQIFGCLRDSRRKLNDYMSTLERGGSYVPSNHTEALTESCKEALLLEPKLTSMCSHTLISVRDGMPEQGVWKALQDIRDLSQRLLSITGEYDEKVRFIDKVIFRDIQYARFDSKAW
ncbi:MAG: hypothetical protein M1840_006934 [Geoglossum simile]|nr:MAG: hypothetical protein M1840_006934 [Geoglossum simile]